MKYKTPWISKNDVERKWYVVDVAETVLGRSATQIAELLIGKGKTNYVPNIDCGDYVIVLNSKKVNVTGGKELKKMYYRHSGYPGALKETRYDRMMATRPNYIIEHAVKLMIPDNKLRDARMARLFIYEDTNHDQAAQKPEEYKL